MNRQDARGGALAIIILAGSGLAGRTQDTPAPETTDDTTAGDDASREPGSLFDPAPEGPGIALGPFTLSGVFSQRYRFRVSGDDSDQDVYGYLDLSAAYPNESREGRLPYSKLRFNLQASYSVDVDSFRRAGSVSGTNFFPFLGISDTFSDRLLVFLHSANVEVDDIAFLERLRAGRQQLHREVGLLFDGGWLRTKRWRTFSLELFGGLPTHLYESSASGDALAGITLETEPLRGLTLAADYVFLRDERREFAGAVEEHLYMLRGRYLIDREWSLRASASWTGTRDRRQVVELRYLSEAWGLLGQLRLLRQNGIVEFQPDEISPYVFVMGSYAPHYQLQFDLHQPLGEKFAVGGGLNVRELEDSGDAGIFNHSFRNYYLSADAQGLWPGGKISARMDIWDADGEDIYTAGFEVEQRVLEFLRVRVGSNYSLYRVDPLTATERDKDRVYYARFRWYLTSDLDFDTGYQYEKDSFTEYHRVTAGLRWTF